MPREKRLRTQIEKCRRCEACRDLLHSSCVFFPEMFRLLDGREATPEALETDHLRKLVSLCNFCAGCPCSELRTAILEAKTYYAGCYGLRMGVRVLERVEQVGRLGGRVPRLSNFLLENRPVRVCLNRLAGLHPDRRLPRFPEKNLDRRLHGRPPGSRSASARAGKVVYFTGCTARYFFPEVASATIQVLERNGLRVEVPEQHCCGMPALLEGDIRQSIKNARRNLSWLAEVAESDWDIVCSCPTCAYVLKKVWRKGADQAIFKRDLHKTGNAPAASPGRPVEAGAFSEGYRLKISSETLSRVLKDNGAFSELSPGKRVLVSEKTYDLGEYLIRLHRAGGLDTRLKPLEVRAAYYPPCHLREQRVGLPYQELLRMIPGASVESITGDTCCGNAGIMGFKKEFHPWSIRIGGRLMARVRNLNPGILATDCLSCRLQFTQFTSCFVIHPIQLLQQAYDPAGFPLSIRY